MQRKRLRLVEKRKLVGVELIEVFLQKIEVEITLIFVLLHAVLIHLKNSQSRGIAFMHGEHLVILLVKRRGIDEIGLAEVVTSKLQRSKKREEKCLSEHVHEGLQLLILIGQEEDAGIQVVIDIYSLVVIRGAEINNHGVRLIFNE